ASFKDWDTADLAIQLARKVTPGENIDGSRAFQSIAKIAPHLAIRLREYWIRFTRPSTRTH
ncbi:MAG: hypothetical protein AAF558_04440, partial [Verrucomicrobiota bacterium]